MSTVQSSGFASEYDITIIGGGINGVAVAAEAASRGLRTLLVHGRDLASGASAPPVCLAAENLQRLSALDYFQLNSLLEELQLLHGSAPHLIDLLPVEQLNGEAANGGNTNLTAKLFKALRNRALSSQLQQRHRGFNIAARLKPARLVVCLALHAQKYGADIRTYHRVTNAERFQDHWLLRISNALEKGNEFNVRSKLVINCSGWLANDVLEKLLKVETRAKATEEFRTQFFFKNPLIHDPAKRKIIKVYGENMHFYVYHATDEILSFGPVKCDQEGYAECINLQDEFIAAWNNSPELVEFARPLTPEDILYKRRGNIALIQDPCGKNDAPLTAPLLDINNPGNAAVLLNIFGADPAIAEKIARQAMDVLYDFTNSKANPQFCKDKLPGGDINAESMPAFIEKLCSEFNQLPPKLVHRLARNYGSLAYVILGESKTEQDLGEHFGNLLYECEVDYLVKLEWATCADDILERRTFIHLSAGSEVREKLEKWFASQ
ncbi:glycerol-3-phosphate dehydrogenase [Alteromonadaceae bacterium 2753L.S.0a.02]|nr:glycerol-3-phosphate dehydrogenase [Alteromonadaceae bacterium 2753L.S.0a.02]